MVIHGADGAIFRRRFSPANCIGYIAERIELEPGDIDAIINLALSRPHEFKRTMWQLKHRFESERYAEGSEESPALTKCRASLVKELLKTERGDLDK